MYEKKIFEDNSLSICPQEKFKSQKGDTKGTKEGRGPREKGDPGRWDLGKKRTQEKFVLAQAKKCF